MENGKGDSVSRAKFYSGKGARKISEIPDEVVKLAT